MDMQNTQAHLAKAITLDKMSAAERADYDATMADLASVIEAERLTRYDVAQRSGIASPTLNPWMDGTTKGSYPNTTKKVRDWLNTLSDAAALVPTTMGLQRPDFVETPTARRISTMLAYAQTTPSMVVGTFGSGMGNQRLRNGLPLPAQT